MCIRDRYSTDASASAPRARPTQTTSITPRIVAESPALDCARSKHRQAPSIEGVVLDEEPRERHLNIHFSPEIMAGVYANFANVSHSDYEFTVTFARVDHEIEDDEIPGVVVSRVNLSPRFMRELIDAMEDNYSKWATHQGIKNLPEYHDQEDDEPPVDPPDY